MELHDALRARRAARSFDDRNVPDAVVRSLLDAAVLAPSAMNAQPWTFSIVADRQKMHAWSDRAKAMLLASFSDEKTRRYGERLNRSDFDIFYEAPVLVVIGAAHRTPYVEADAWLAAENLMLAATAGGLGTCVIGLAVPLLNEPDVRRELGLTSEGVAIAPIILGYAKAPADYVARRSPQVLSWLR